MTPTTAPDLSLVPPTLDEVAATADAIAAALPEALRLDAVHARLAAGSATTGSFATAAGSLVDFLRAERPRPPLTRSAGGGGP
jgi:hypothetical protein